MTSFNFFLLTTTSKQKLYEHRTDIWAGPWIYRQAIHDMSNARTSTAVLIERVVAIARTVKVCAVQIASAK